VTLFTVLDGTGRHSDLSERILGILHTVAPIVQSITSIPLPGEVRFRLLTAKAWRDAFRQNTHRILARDIADLPDLTPEELQQARAKVSASGVAAVLLWPLMLANTMEAADGHSETVIAPRALRHGGVLADEPCLHQVVAHELVHHLQAEARSGAVWRTLFPERRQIRPRGMVTVVEGHAAWVDGQVTTRLFGEPADHRQARKSWRYRIHDRPFLRRGGPSREDYEGGSALIARAVEAHGVDLVNRVWKDGTLLPTTEEMAEPAAWIRRLAM
jgi:hypothetical protein